MNTLSALYAHVWDNDLVTDNFIELLSPYTTAGTYYRGTSLKSLPAAGEVIYNHFSFSREKNIAFDFMYKGKTSPYAAILVVESTMGSIELCYSSLYERLLAAGADLSKLCKLESTVSEEKEMVCLSRCLRVLKVTDFGGYVEVRCTPV